MSSLPMPRSQELIIIDSFEAYDEFFAFLSKSLKFKLLKSKQLSVNLFKDNGYNMLT